jgi:hypothetical protein
MPVTRAKKVDVLRRREHVADLYIQGHTQVAIAEKLGVKQPTISQDLTAIRKLWRESSIRNFDEAKELELQKLDRVEREAWAAWERSQKPTQSATVEGDGVPKRSRKTISQRNGDPRYLDTVLKCVAARRAILGLDAPTKIAPTTPDGQELSFSERQVHIQAILTERFGLAAVTILQGASDETAQPGTITIDALVDDGRGNLAIESAQAADGASSEPQDTALAASGILDAGV